MESRPPCTCAQGSAQRGAATAVPAPPHPLLTPAPHLPWVSSGRQGEGSARGLWGWRGGHGCGAGISVEWLLGGVHRSQHPGLRQDPGCQLQPLCWTRLCWGTGRASGEPQQHPLPLPSLRSTHRSGALAGAQQQGRAQAAVALTQAPVRRPARRSSLSPRLAGTGTGTGPGSCPLPPLPCQGPTYCSILT